MDSLMNAFILHLVMPQVTISGTHGASRRRRHCEYIYHGKVDGVDAVSLSHRSQKGNQNNKGCISLNEHAHHNDNRIMTKRNRYLLWMVPSTSAVNCCGICSWSESKQRRGAANNQHDGCRGSHGLLKTRADVLKLQFLIYYAQHQE